MQFKLFMIACNCKMKTILLFVQIIFLKVIFQRQNFALFALYF